ncbi:MAG: radical SAM family heme chaperone HemW [Bifidobacteriaceae bacterium]|nr:radical SAM family heme chaperone HemW [Bifidobacteriaceae bacterium]
MSGANQISRAPLSAAPNGALAQDNTAPGALDRSSTELGALAQDNTDPGALAQDSTELGALARDNTDPGALGQDNIAPGALDRGNTELGELRPFQIYIHVPYCTRRCGYCDFNTYVAGGEERAGFAALVRAELELAARALEEWGREVSGVDTVFFGGGTPTVLAAPDLVGLLDAVRGIFGLRGGAEITTEANPDTVDRTYLAALADGGFTRVSFGMQSAVPHVLRTLERTHSPDAVALGVEAAAAVGLTASADLIYGTPGETIADWETSLRAALALGVNHISAYALTLEGSVPLARRIRRRQLPPVDADAQAAMYELADQMFHSHGFRWYEISNWAKPGYESRHNYGYWTGAEWWGIGPGAHSAIRGERFWNMKLPRAYAAALEKGELPIAGRDVPDAAGRELERIMLGLRTRSGIALADLSHSSLRVSEQLVQDGLAAVNGSNLVLTLRGRLLADTVTRALMFV